MLKPPGIIGGLGYRGFTIRAVGERLLDQEIYVHAGIIDVGPRDINRFTDSPELEQFLLRTGGENVDPPVRDLVLAALNDRKLFSAAARIGVLAAPPYDPGKWNNDPNIRTRNNCYNYASDKITNTFAQPGRGSGSMYTAFDCANVGAAAQRDGQILIPNPNITPTQGHIVTLVMWPGNDFHWYRRDANGMWSHKPGSTPARNTDNSGNLISDPNTCDRGPYTAVCSSYNSIPAQTRIN